MKKLMPLLFTPLLFACAWNPVLTPYAVSKAKELPVDQIATVWGFQDGPELFFTHANGEGLPSRGGGGYPVSLSLEEGTHTIKAYFNGLDNRWAYVDIPANVEAGHTYIVEYELSSDGTRVGLRLKDLGTTVRCHYERYDAVRGSARLVCGSPAGA